jgi:ferrous iron transport protein B
VILGINILLWFLATYPKPLPASGTTSNPAAVAGAPLQTSANPSGTVSLAVANPEEEAGAALRDSYAGRLGRWIEPAIRPLGFDWKIGIGLVASFAAREVFVSTMSVVYNVGELDDSEAGTASLAEVMKKERHADGRPVYTPLTGVTLMVFYVFAMQCVSTVAVVRRETNSWKWPAFQFAYMTALAWILAFVTFQVGRWAGF